MVVQGLPPWEAVAEVLGPSLSQSGARHQSSAPLSHCVSQNRVRDRSAGQGKPALEERTQDGKGKSHRGWRSRLVGLDSQLTVAPEPSGGQGLAMGQAPVVRTRSGPHCQGTAHCRWAVTTPRAGRSSFWPVPSALVLSSLQTQFRPCLLKVLKEHSSHIYAGP